KLSCILLHELCHVKRYDLLKNYIWLVAKTIYWFNPLVHIAYKNYIENIEVVCDERVIKSLEPNDQCEYTQSLLDVMRLIKKQNELPLTVSFCKNKSTIKRRVLNIMKPAKKSKTVMLITILLACVLIVTCFTTACLKGEVEETLPTVESKITNTAEKTTTPPTKTISPDTIESINGFIDTKKVVFNGKQAIKDLELLEIDMIDYIQPNMYFEHKVLDYSINRNVYCTLFESDLSLMYYANYNLTSSMPMQFSDDELIKVATDFVKRFYGIEDIEILKHEVKNYSVESIDDFFQFIIEGTIGEDEQPFEIKLNGEGDLYSYRRFPTNINWDMGISMDEAKSIAIEKIKNDTYEIDESKLVLINDYLKVKYTPMYVFEYEYRSDNPTVTEYDFDYQIRVYASNGEIYFWAVRPIADNIDIIQMDEAEKLAIEHLAQNTEHKDISKYKKLELYTDVIIYQGELVYTFYFDYGDEYIYYLMMTGTGEVLRFAGSAKG
ncbi:MAG: hypothetical protein KAQ68_08135, partial [Clostridiales bacterium]|nr:hypothetical protein [Clostridiales bacterium]